MKSRKKLKELTNKKVIVVFLTIFGVSLFYLLFNFASANINQIISIIMLVAVVLCAGLSILDKKNYQSWMSLAIAIIGTSILFSQTHVMTVQNSILNQQTEILKQQTEILNKTTAPRQAFLEIIPDKDDWAIPVWEIINSKDLDLEADKRWARIDLTILNFGQMDSNHLNCFQKNYSDPIFTYITPNSNFQNIPAGSSERATLHVLYRACYNTNEQMCDKPELVPLGNHTIELECECNGCKEQRRFKTPISFCIYYTNMTSECPISAKEI